MKTGAQVLLIIVTARGLTADDRRLNGQVERIVAKSGLSREQLVADVRRMLSAWKGGRS